MTDLEFNGVKGRSRTWVEAGGGADLDQWEPGARASGAVDLGFTPDPDRAQDLVMLRALLDDTGLKPGEREAFGGMLDALEADRRKYDVLSLKQRAWATGRALELGIELGDPAVRNRDVPRGREVAPAPVLQNRPLSPPGRRAPEQATLFNGVPAGESPLYLPEGAPISPLEAYTAAGLGVVRPERPGDPCPDCGKPVHRNRSGLSCHNGHGYSDPNPMEVSATPPDTISQRPSSGVVGARRRPQPLGRQK